MTSDAFTALDPKTAGPDLQDLFSQMRYVKRHHGVGYFQQIYEILRLRFGRSEIGASEYYYYSLFDTALTFARKEDYVGWRRWSRLERSMVSPEWWVLFEDKLIFQALADACNIPQAATLAILRSGQYASAYRVLQTVQDLSDFFVAHQSDFPIFGKPVSTGRGIGIVRIDKFDRASASVFTSTGNELSVSEFFEAAADYKQRGYLFQKVVEQHRDIVDLVGDVLATFRFVVAIDDDSVTINQVVWKIPLAGNVVDNFAHGNMIAGVQIDKGTITRVLCSAGPAVKEVRDHPDTGARLVGQKIPHWNDLKAFVVSVAMYFSDIRLQGWDIALSKNGPIVIEANVAGDETLPQLANRSGALAGSGRHILRSALKLTP